MHFRAGRVRTRPAPLAAPTGPLYCVSRNERSRASAGRGRARAPRRAQRRSSAAKQVLSYRRARRRGRPRRERAARAWRAARRACAAAAARHARVRRRLARCGAAPVPWPSDSTPSSAQEEYRHVVADSGARLLIAEDALLGALGPLATQLAQDEPARHARRWREAVRAPRRRRRSTTRAAGGRGLLALLLGHHRAAQGHRARPPRRAAGGAGAARSGGPGRRRHGVRHLEAVLRLRAGERPAGSARARRHRDPASRLGRRRADSDHRRPPPPERDVQRADLLSPPACAAARTPGGVSRGAPLRLRGRAAAGAGVRGLARGHRAGDPFRVRHV